MTKVTVRCSAIKGTLTIYGSPTDSTQFLVEGASYEPMRFTADTLGEAVDTLMRNLHQLRYNSAVLARNKERSKRMSEHHANRHATTKRSKKGKPSDDKTTTDLSDVHS